jgi:heme-degrading monooxygenase HmoA
VDQISVINTILVPPGMQVEAELIREQYIAYFSQQDGFVSSTFYKSLSCETDDSIKYVNIVVWASQSHFDSVVNKGFQNEGGVNSDGMRVLGKGFPAPIKVSPGRFQVIKHNHKLL